MKISKTLQVKLRIEKAAKAANSKGFLSPKSSKKGKC
jgi:hypothetical protein